MKILFDQGTPVPLRRALEGHEISTAFELGWSTLKNGDLLRSAEQHGFDILITTDTNLRYQQNLSARKIAIIVLMTTSWPRISSIIHKISSAVNTATSNSYCEITIP